MSKLLSRPAADSKCAAIHDLLPALPVFASPEDARKASFRDGLYFFYEEGETSSHASGGRIVRVGNHPRKAGGLHQRLLNHYRSGKGAKNGSVFRRYLGGAIIRRENPGSSCLQPGPGRGHWETQDAHTCPLCQPYESRVTELLRAGFSLRCVAIPEQSLRNELEKRLVATLSACPTCEASQDWLGRHCYSEKVRNSGLWNSNGVGGPHLTDLQVEQFGRLVAETLHG